MNLDFPTTTTTRLVSATRGAIGLLLGLATLGAQAAPTYRIEAVPPVGGYWPSTTAAINNLGQVVGVASYGSQYFCFVYADGVTHILLDSAGVTCTDINDQGTVVGYTMGFNQTAYVWPHWSSARSDLPGMATARRINNQGQIAGSYTIDWIMGAPAVYSHGEITKLDTLSGFGGGEATSIDENGKVVGYATAPSTFDHAVSWTLGHRIKDLGTLGGRQSRALALSSAGHIVGDSDLADGSIASFIVKGRSGMQQLPDSDNPNKTLHALGVNAKGDVVGYLTGQQDKWFATLTRKGKTHKLLDLAEAASGSKWWNLHTARDINDAGQIVGAGSYRGDFSRGAYIATPIETAEP